VNTIDTWDRVTRKAWDSFVKEEKLSEQQSKQFELYMTMLTEFNAVTNITRIMEPKDVINFHFKDSLALAHARDLTLCKGLCDVGSGGGFPGIPLAICFPELPIILLEISQKKRVFLQAVIDELKLPSCQVMSEDYLTFIRSTSYTIDYFVARASLRAGELIRALNSPSYKQVEIVYWASQHWEAESPEKSFLAERFAYKVEGQHRFLVFFKRNDKQI
jgi:16S rRNA (guanine527-N7)-methyltransferase